MEVVRRLLLAALQGAVRVPVHVVAHALARHANRGDVGGQRAFLVVVTVLQCLPKIAVKMVFPPRKRDRVPTLRAIQSSFLTMQLRDDQNKYVVGKIEVECRGLLLLNIFRIAASVYSGDSVSTGISAVDVSGPTG